MLLTSQSLLSTAGFWNPK